MFSFFVLNGLPALPSGMSVSDDPKYPKCLGQNLCLCANLAPQKTGKGRRTDGNHPDLQEGGKSGKGGIWPHKSVLYTVLFLFAFCSNCFFGGMERDVFLFLGSWPTWCAGEGISLDVPGCQCKVHCSISWGESTWKVFLSGGFKA